jgi:protein-S-isoprenylcysteine O-methyltransferase Ste14
MGPFTYAGLAAVVLLVSYLVFRVVVRRDYERHGRLAPLSVFMEYVAIVSWVGFTYVNLPEDWPRVHVGPVLEAFGSALFCGGLSLTAIILVFLGFRRSHGREVTKLRQSGFYGLSRNPQAMAFVVAIIGHLVLWPTWKNLVSFGLLLALLRLMVHTEEEHLRRVFGEEYERYYRRVPRFIGLRRGAERTGLGPRA